MPEKRKSPNNRQRDELARAVFVKLYDPNGSREPKFLAEKAFDAADTFCDVLASRSSDASPSKPKRE